MKDPEPIIKSLVEDNKIDISSLEMIQMEAICETFGWTVEEYEKTPLNYIDSFSSILKGREKGRKK